MDNKLIIPSKNSYDIYSIKARISDYLKDRNYNVTEQQDYITFRLNPIIISSGNQDWPYRVFKILKEGRIKLNKQYDSIEINWNVKFDSLYFITFSLAFFIAFFAGLFMRPNIVASVIVCFFCFLLFIVIGRLLLKSQIKNMIVRNAYYDD